MQGKEIRERVFYLDVVRAVAIVLVLMTHSFFAKYPEGMAYTESDALFGSFYLFTLSCNGMFFMLSGALVLDKEIRQGYGFFWKRIARFLLLLAVWAVVTNVCGYVFHGMPFWEAVWQSVRYHSILIGGWSGYASYLWFMTVIVHLYVAAPFLARMVRDMPGRMYWIFVAATCVFMLLPGSFDYQHQLRSFIDADNALIWGQFNVFGSFASWFILGYLFFRTDTEEWLGRYVRHYNLLLVCLLLFSALAGGYLEYRWTIADNLHFYAPLLTFSSSIFTFVNSILLFLLCKHLAAYLTGWRRWIEIVSCHSFGIYLVHFGILFGVRYLLESVGIGPEGHPAKVYFSCLFLLFVFSLTASILLGKVRCLRWLIK